MPAGVVGRKVPTNAATALADFERTLRGKPLATNNFASGAHALPKARAVACAEIAPDPDGWIRALRVDVDLDYATVAWMDAELPPPTFIIRRRSNGHAHLVWELRRWVRTGTRAERYLQRIRAAYTEACGGDRSYAGRFQHNPLASWAWEVKVGRAEPYTLGELATHVDLFAPYYGAGRAELNADNEQLGRNCSIFEHVRIAVYRTVQLYRERNDYAAFEQDVRERVQRENEEFPIPLPSRDVRSLTRSIAQWTWGNYGQGRHAAQQRRDAGKLRRAEYEARAAERAQRIHKLRAEGLGAGEIAKHLGCSVRLVHLRLAQTVQSAPLSELARVAAPTSVVPNAEPRSPVTIQSGIFFSPRRSVLSGKLPGDGIESQARNETPVRWADLDPNHKRGPDDQPLGLPDETSLGFGRFVGANLENQGYVGPSARCVEPDRVGQPNPRTGTSGCPRALREWIYAMLSGRPTAGKGLSNADVRGRAGPGLLSERSASHVEVRGPWLTVAPGQSESSHAEVRGRRFTVAPDGRSSNAEVRGPALTVAPGVASASRPEVRGRFATEAPARHEPSHAEVRGGLFTAAPAGLHSHIEVQGPALALGALQEALGHRRLLGWAGRNGPAPRISP